MTKKGMNVAHELLPGVSYPEHITDDARAWKIMGLNNFRVAMSDYGNTNAITYAKMYINRLREIFPTATIIWGVNKKNNKWRLPEWEELKEKHIEGAQYAQSKNVWYQLFNEDTNYWCIQSESIISSTKSGSSITVTLGVKHGLSVGESVTISGIGSLMTIGASSETITGIIDDYSFTFTPNHPGTDGTTTGGFCQPNAGLIRNRYKSLAVYLRSIGITIPLIGSVGQGGLSVWSSGDTEITLAFNIYGEGATAALRLANFKSQIDTFITIPQPTGAPKMITEYGIHASFSQYPASLTDQIYELKERRLYAEEKCDKAFLHCWRSNSWSGSQNDDFAMRLTWSQTYAPLHIRWTEVFN